PDLLRTAAELLENMRFSGIAEVEFKQDVASLEYKLIEINPRPWDQHRLGNACGVDLIQIAYCDLAALPIPEVGRQKTGQKWMSEDVCLLLLLRSLWKRERNFCDLLGQTRGQRIYPVSSIRDPLPLITLLGLGLLPDLAMILPRYLRSKARPLARPTTVETGKF